MEARGAPAGHRARWSGALLACERDAVVLHHDINLADSTLRRWQFGEDGILTLPSTGKISNSDYNWTFSADGRTTFPNGTVPAHSYGAAGDKEGMVVFTDPYIYYCKTDYVNNTTDIWVRVAWTGTSW